MRIHLPPAAVGRFGALLVRVLARTVRITRRADDPDFDFFNPHRPPAIWSFWHGRLLLVAVAGADTGAYIPISRHRDGEYVARMGTLIGVQPVRGSTRRGGARALKALVRAAREADVAFTPDGPRGPRYVVAPGLVHLARLSGRAIVPCGIEASPAWRAPSWDEFTVPCPAARMAVVQGEPVLVPRRAEGEALERCRRRVQEGMDSATGRALRMLGR